VLFHVSSYSVYCKPLIRKHPKSLFVPRECRSISITEGAKENSLEVIHSEVNEFSDENTSIKMLNLVMRGNGDGLLLCLV
jgi:hypothetical protein